MSDTARTYGQLLAETKEQAADIERLTAEMVSRGNRLAETLSNEAFLEAEIERLAAGLQGVLDAYEMAWIDSEGFKTAWIDNEGFMGHVYRTAKDALQHPEKGRRTNSPEKGRDVTTLPKTANQKEPCNE